MAPLQVTLKSSLLWITSSHSLPGLTPNSHVCIFGLSIGNREFLLNSLSLFLFPADFSLLLILFPFVSFLSLPSFSVTLAPFLLFISALLVFPFYLFTLSPSVEAAFQLFTFPPSLSFIFLSLHSALVAAFIFFAFPPSPWATFSQFLPFITPFMTPLSIILFPYIIFIWFLCCPKYCSLP